jgi:hypothetical protein
VAASRELTEAELDQNTRFTFVMQMTTQVRLCVFVALQHW